MNFFKLFSRKKKDSNVRPSPPWNEIVDMMHDKYLDAFADEVVTVIYSLDRSMRYVVLKCDNGLLTYQLEAIYQYDEDELRYICSDDKALPAMWEPFHGVGGKSLFESEKELLKEMKSEPEYKRYFQ